MLAGHKPKEDSGRIRKEELSVATYGKTFHFGGCLAFAPDPWSLTDLVLDVKQRRCIRLIVNHVSITVILLYCCRWTLSSKKPPTWTTWPSCMRVGLPGCECYVASCLWSSEGLEIHLSPAGLGCRNSSTRPHWGEEVGSGCLVRRTRLLVTQKGEVTS